MVRSNRIKEFKFTTSDLIADASGNIETYSERPLNGTIQKVIFEAGNYTATGSLYVNISGGVSEPVWQKINNVNADSVAYPTVYTEDNEATTGSPDSFTQRVINSTVQIVASGLGSGKSGLGLTVYYI
jgi:hypothetical protein|tara:strand:- start:165 stop:548 length:384 start_codon:yes stop_codon:yes gene_type:complete